MDVLVRFGKFGKIEKLDVFETHSRCLHLCAAARGTIIGEFV
jgi:hypothetical protein